MHSFLRNCREDLSWYLLSVLFCNGDRASYGDGSDTVTLNVDLL